MARSCPCAGDPSCVVGALFGGLHVSSNDHRSVWPTALSPDSVLEGAFSDKLATERSFLRLPLGRLGVALSEGLVSIAFITTQLLVHFQSARYIFAGTYRSRHRGLQLASRLRSEYRIHWQNGNSPCG